MSFIDTVIDKIERLTATASKNEKLEILKTLSQDELSIFQAAIDPTINYYVAKLPKIDSHGQGEFNLSTCLLLSDLQARRLTGNAALDRIEQELKDLREPHSNLLRKILLKDLRAGVGDTLLNTAHPGAVPVFPYMRCSLPDKSNLNKWGQDVWDEGVISDEKADGMFASLTTGHDGQISLLSRQGSRFPADSLPALHTFHEPLRGYQLHGELLVKGPDGQVLERQVGNGILNSLLQDGVLPDNHEVTYVVWDAVPVEKAVPKGKGDTPLKLRRECLHAMVAKHPAVNVIEYEVVHSKDAAMAHYRKLLAAGKEGTIVKSPRGLWADGTSKDCVKLKLTFCVDLKITGVTEGTGKNADLFGSLSCATACGALEVDVAGISDDLRKHLHELHKEGKLVDTVASVYANGVMAPSANNDRYSLFLPRLAEVRFDKSEADDLSCVLAQLKAAIA